MRTYWVYMMSNQARCIYTGVTSNLQQRVFQHRARVKPGFTRKYNLIRLVYLEATHSVLDAIAREKQIKRWNRRKKIALIERMNPGWKDLAEHWFE